MNHGQEGLLELWHIESTNQGKAHVIAIDKGNTLQVSIRGSEGIGELCKMFGGGGRATAGGIDALPKDEITALMNEVNSRSLLEVILCRTG